MPENKGSCHVFCTLDQQWKDGSLVHVSAEVAGQNELLFQRVLVLWKFKISGLIIGLGQKKEAK